MRIDFSTHLPRPGRLWIHRIWDAGPSQRDVCDTTRVPPILLRFSLRWGEGGDVHTHAPSCLKLVGDLCPEARA